MFSNLSKSGILLGVKLDLKEENDLDFDLLEPGDLLVVANPTDRWFVRYLSFWSHVGIVTEDGVVDAIRDPRGEHIEEQRWGTVQCVPLTIYSANHDIIALRVKCSREKRVAAAKYAVEKLGLSYSPTLLKILLGRRDTTHYSCASLMWQAYKAQGIDLDPLPWKSDLILFPALLLRSPHIEVIAQGTRHRPTVRSWRNLGLIMERLWFKYVLRANIEIMTQ
jgi:uncharacterized protein YycO